MKVVEQNEGNDLSAHKHKVYHVITFVAGAHGCITEVILKCK